MIYIVHTIKQLKVGDTHTDGQVSLLFSMYNTLFEVDQDSLKSHLVIADRKLTINGKNNEIIEMIAAAMQ